MYIDKSATEMEVYIPVRIGEYDAEKVYLGTIDSEPSKRAPCIKATIRLPVGWWAAIDPPTIESHGDAVAVSTIKTEAVVEEVEL